MGTCCQEDWNRSSKPAGKLSGVCCWRATQLGEQARQNRATEASGEGPGIGKGSDGIDADAAIDASRARWMQVLMDEKWAQRRCDGRSSESTNVSGLLALALTL